MPSPHAQIVIWLYLESRSTGEIIRRLREWGGISSRQAERLIRLTKTMLRAIGRDERPRDLWPERLDRKKNRFLMSGFGISRVK